MNSLTRIMSYDKTLNQGNCNCNEYVSENVKLENQTLEYPKLSEEEIEQIINERYSDKDDKTKTFIRKALRKHGDRYNYSNVVYVKAKEYVEIICKVKGHKPFPMTPDNHLQGRGCSECKFEKLANLYKLTTEEFIERSNEIYGIGRYDYSKVNYINIDTKVIIICHNHDEPYEFEQKPKNHLNGHGCSKCSRNKKLTTEEFIKESNIVHGEGTYDYSKVKYVNYDTEVIIICPNHDEPYEFPQTPDSHLHNHGCPLCGGSQKLTIEEFIERANKIHGLGTYDYSKVNYINMYTDVIITCPKHSDFPQTPSNHLKGEDCPICDESKGETRVRLFLTKNKIEFEQEKRFNDCRNIHPLPFDFYLPKYNLCIEFDGKGHFKKINWSGKMAEEQMEENLKSNQLRDQIKNNYCKEKGINLLRIRYDENVEEKLTEYFQNNNLIKD